MHKLQTDMLLGDVMWGSHNSVTEDLRIFIVLPLKMATMLRNVGNFYQSTRSNISEDLNLVYGFCFEKRS
jgi:hypothetical protein